MIFHLSHIDLDGFFCQYLSSITFSWKNEEIRYFNANYGPEVLKNLKKIKKQITTSDKLIVTDLSLSDEEIAFLCKLRDLGIDVEVFDHHPNPKLEKKNYPWITIDTTISASKLFSKKVGGGHSRIIKYVDAYDIWNESDEDVLIKGAMFSEIINQNPLFVQNQDKVCFFNKFFTYVEQFLERNLMRNVYELFYGFCLNEFNVGDSNFTSLKYELSKKYIANMKIEKVYGAYVIFYEMDKEYFQYISSGILKTNNDLIICNFRKNGRVAFRSRSFDVNQLAKDYFNGAGHKNASGGHVKSTINSVSDCIQFLPEKEFLNAI